MPGRISPSRRAGRRRRCRWRAGRAGHRPFGYRHALLPASLKAVRRAPCTGDRRCAGCAFASPVRSGGRLVSARHSGRRGAAGDGSWAMGQGLLRARTIGFKTGTSLRFSATRRRWVSPTTIPWRCGSAAPMAARAPVTWDARPARRSCSRCLACCRPTAAPRPRRRPVRSWCIRPTKSGRRRCQTFQREVGHRDAKPEAVATAVAATRHRLFRPTARSCRCPDAKERRTRPSP